MNEIEYKYNYWVLTFVFLLSVTMLNPVYRMVDGLSSTKFNDYWHATIILSLIIWMMSASLSMLIKLLKGLPAILLNDKFLVSNVKNITIKWSDIKSVIIGGSRSPYLVIELVESSVYFPNSTMKKIRNFFSLGLNTNEIAIGLTVVLDDNDEILRTISEFHQKYK